MTEKPAGSKPYKRQVRNILIHKPMQKEFIFVMVSLMIVSCLAVGFVIHATLGGAAAGGGFRFGRISGYEVLSDVRYQLLLRVTLVLLATYLILGLFSIFFLHRVAGPVYRFRNLFLRINDGEIPNPLKLREGDFFSETAIEINRLIRRLHFEKTRSALLREKADQILAGPGDGASKAARELKTILDKDLEEG